MSYKAQHVEARAKGAGPNDSENTELSFYPAGNLVYHPSSLSQMRRHAPSPTNEPVLKDSKYSD
jgi:hypothetical protein